MITVELNNELSKTGVLNNSIPTWGTEGKQLIL